MVDDHIVAVGSLNDCELLVEKFSLLAKTNLSFANFALIWKKSNFELIFCGRSSDELPQLASELLEIAKTIVLNTSHTFESRVGGLYLMYGFYFTQQSKSKIRFTLCEFQEFMMFVIELKERDVLEAQFIFYKLFLSKAFLFCTSSTPNKRQLEEEVDHGNNVIDYECRLIDCEGLSMNSLTDVDILHTKYEEVKTNLPGFVTENSSSAASNKNFPSELRTTLDLLKSEILKSNGCNIKRGKSVISSEVEENQGVIRRKIVNSSFQSQRLSRRLPGSGRSDESARRALLSRSPNS
ncbi:uncharacterized protein LOC116929623 isoform X2 [Daphnia magna]|uniref:snRNA-activating protein complex subunit 1 n=1 Tax=Daphnia magna TaxID=35525 RepID=A0ABR0B8M1_9CRUS|nr:uncharacterized protein LOC116929623 isoform X2 [Daphnia magna]KAK4037877.1 hypothetical protein OUZ56_029903 [Daphnia magna]